MAFSRNHAFVSAIPDGADATVVRPSNWNANHGITDAVSGGIPYFSSTTAEGTSALLAANSIVLGGGSGAAPLTSSNLTWAAATGQGLAMIAGTATTDVAAMSLTRTNNNAAVATGVKWTFTDTTSASGFLPFQILGGSAATTNLFSVDKNGYAKSVEYIWTNGSGTLVGNIAGDDTSAGITITGGAARSASVSLVKWTFASGYAVGWSADGDPRNASDTAFSRISAGLLGLGTGAAGSFAGGLKLTNLTVNRAATFLSTSLALTDGAGAQVGTLTSSPVSGNPSKWIGIDDNGTTRYIPAW